MTATRSTSTPHEPGRYYYGAFDLVSVEDGRVSRWTTTVRGAKGILVAPSGVVLVGSYEAPWSASLWQLGNGELLNPRRVAVPSGGPTGRPEIAGRGSTLWLVDKGQCWKATLAP
jgi:hypothetical protein